MTRAIATSRAALVHHLVSGLSKLLQRSPALKWLNKLVTGSLEDPTKIYFNGLHRLYNEGVKQIVQQMEKDLGKELGQFSRQEVADLGRRILDSADSRIQNFIESLGKTQTGQTARQAL